MRAVTIEGTKAFFTNIRGINTLPQEEGPDAHMTAPFNVVWQANEHSMGPVVRLKNTIIAHIDLRKNPNQLVVRDGVPESCDFAIIRAVQNAATFMKQEAARKRAQDGKKPPAPEKFFSPRGENGQDLDLVGWDVPRLINAAVGAQKSRSNISASEQTYRQGFSARLKVPYGNTHKTLYCRTTPTGLRVIAASSGLNAETLRDVLEAGERDWEELLRSGRLLRSLLKFSDVRYDRASLLQDFIESKIRLSAAPRHKIGDFQISGDCDVYFENIRIASTYWGILTSPTGFEGRGPGRRWFFSEIMPLVEGHEDEASLALSNIIAILAVRTINKKFDDYPPIDRNELHDAVMGIDYGYLG